MAEQTVTAYVPLDVSLPPIPTEQVFSDLQWKTLLALADTVIPSVRSPSSPKSLSTKVVPDCDLKAAVSTLASHMHDPEATKIAEQYLEETGSANPLFVEGLRRLFAEYIHQEGRNGISLILNALNSKAGSLLLTGSITAIQDQPFEVRERVFRSWETSRIKPLRAIYRAFTAIFKKTWISVSPTIRLVVGFPRVPIHGKPADGFEYKFLQFPPGDKPEIIEADVVIVGSGCGGSVAAKNLAEAGYKVLVVEKSYHYPSKHFPMDFTEGFVNMFETGGATMSDDGSMAVLAGSTWGGGGTVNWSAALQTQGYVRREWASNGLPFFESFEFQQSLDHVCERMGVSSEHTKHNFANRILLDGARKLGYAAKPVPQNTGGTAHYCGYCTMGCHSTDKKGPTETFLADAADAGATFVEGFRAEKILFKKTKGGRVASGIQGTWTSRDSYLGTTGMDRETREVIIKADKVIVSCGTLQSPLLLMRSGLKNPQIGRNLYLHPVVLSAAVFEEEIRPWEGAALTTVVNEFENQDNQGHGVKIENVAMLPAVYLPTFPWRDGLDYKLWAAKLPRMTGFIALTKERDAGRVYPDPVDGRARISYSVSAYDRKHIVEALVATAKIAYISGAKEFHTTSREMAPFIRPADASDPNAPEGVNNEALQAWIAELRRQNPVDPERTLYASAHQMGTCRMGASSSTSVVDPNCQVWGAKGLYVMDASVFPSASGVNPMVTNMAIADWASQNVAEMLKREKSESLMARL
ncbi:putative long chain fatty alcohol oxidase [Aspergillus clavatus NRRL 1]|uniref:Long-chain-alcohol oxidase n=1 Tax=Aspergillus clavatus (strain ATCC 1007 / CBS 513.65 / DSM 816 / NCTC 3887 / NRRL 1 / QM 1276 / 107) TaxID=344612 RepID=A1CNB5_ASPCL|nr:long chain fatty alcohol oxidase, putative [Aspergillus clavatus NRRL 1]EAW07136.1 long chain fatty alcohol oxidase, putative [Aspergillus clavatus NRRL 1]